MRTTTIETMRWTGPLLPVGWNPAANRKPREPRPAISSKPATSQKPATSESGDQTLRWSGPLPPGVLE
jgi:hypothetical protein